MIKKVMNKIQKGVKCKQWCAKREQENVKNIIMLSQLIDEFFKAHLSRGTKNVFIGFIKE